MTGEDGAEDGVMDPLEHRRPSEVSVPRPSLGPARARSRALDSFRSPRARLALGVALIAALATAWGVVGRGASNPPGPVRVAPPAATTGSSVTARDPATAPLADAVIATPPWVPTVVAATCRAHGTSRASAVVECTPGRGVVSLEYRAFASVAALRAAYAAEGTRDGGVGPSACAQGAPEERSWSAAASPAAPAGRYRCSVVAGKARLVWTSEATGVLGVATRADGDLRSLYQWWTTVPGPTTPVRSGGERGGG